MSEPIKDSEMIKSLTKDEIFGMWKEQFKSNKILKEEKSVLKHRLDFAEKECDRFERLWKTNKNKG